MKMNIKSNNICTFCQDETESLMHLFWNCRHVQTFWTDFQSYLASKNILLLNEWNEKDILLGSLKYDIILNQLLLRAKYFIYQMRLNETIPVFCNFKPNIKVFYKIEKYNAVKNGRIEKFEKLWNTYKSLI